MPYLRNHITLLLLFVLISIQTNSNNQNRKEEVMNKDYYCEYCGHKFPNINTLTAATCAYHPDGNHKGRHKLYEGSEKSSYDCKYCGKKFKTIMQMRVPCSRHPKGMNKGRHAPAL